MLLSVVVLTAGVPALGHAPMNQAETATAPHQIDGAPERQHCHLVDEAPADQAQPTADTSDHSCCDAEETCSHEECSCACPILTLVVPTRLAPSQHLPARIATSNLSAGLPRNTIDTPLRPPQA